MAAKAERAETEGKAEMANKGQLHKPAIHGTMATNAIENQEEAETAEEVSKLVQATPGAIGYVGKKQVAPALKVVLDTAP